MTIRTFIATLAACALVIGCERKTAEDNDTAAGNDTVAVDDTSRDVATDDRDDTNDGIDVDLDEVKDAAGDAAAEVKSESIEKWVELKLAGQNGMDDIDIESQPGGVIILTGTVPNEETRTLAVDIVRNADGVKRVDNRLQVATIVKE